jgi:uncharacterized protein YcfJ
MPLRHALPALLLVTIFAGDVFCQEWYPRRPRSEGLGIAGGLAGAGVGALIGEDKGDAVPGALIGGAVGLLGGAALGDAIDRDEANQQAYARARQQRIAATAASAVTLGDVVSMSKAGVGDEVIVTQLETKGLAHRVTTNDIILLKQQGVSDRVINAMQRSAEPRPVTVAQPVIVEEYYYPPPAPYYVPHYHYYHHHHHPSTGIYFHFRN